jgi:hypothetical protein
MSSFLLRADLDSPVSSGCSADPVEATVAADVTRLEYTGCAEDASVVRYTVHFTLRLESGLDIP